jgi:hypothetical protein
MWKVPVRLRPESWGAVNLFLSDVSPSLGWSEKFFDLNDGESMSPPT